MISAKALALILVVTSIAWGLGDEFSETAPLAPGAPADVQTAVVSQLKQQAVENRLREMLGKDRYATVEKVVTREFAEKYVVDYKPRRVGADRAQLELTGHLDIDGLKKWVRLLDAKHKGTQAMAHLFVLSSNVPGHVFNPGDTAPKVRESTVAQVLLSASSQAMQRVNQKLMVADTSRLTLAAPPKTQNEMRTLSEQLGGGTANIGGVLWIQLSPCKSCGGLKVDSSLYQFAKARAVVTHSDDIALAPNELSQTAKAKVAFRALTSGLQGELEEALSSGAAGGQAIEVSVEGVGSYPGFKGLREQLERLDYVNQIIMTKAQPRAATFEAFSSLSPEELGARLDKETFSGFHLKTQSVDSRGVSVRYLP